jgi:hypothetical protein
LPIRFPIQSERQGVGPFKTLKGSDGRDVIGNTSGQAFLHFRKAHERIAVSVCHARDKQSNGGGRWPGRGRARQGASSDARET